MLYLIYLSGFIWVLPVSLMIPAVWRMVRIRGDRCDMLALPLVFISINQIGYCLRWSIFHKQIPDMGTYEIAMWAGLYSLSIVSALLASVVWRIVRRAV